MLVIVIGLLSIGIFLIYNYWMSIYQKWKKQGIIAIPGKFPYGSSKELSMNTGFPGHIIDELYHQTSQHSYFGIYLVRTPILVIRDPEIIRLIMTKEFSHFRDRFPEIKDENDPVSDHLFNLSGEKWRILRVKLTPTFTSGKMKAMFPLFVNCAEAFHSMLMSKAGSEFDVKELAACFTTDIICSCAFGLETNTTTNPNHELRNLYKYFKTNKYLRFIKDLFFKALPQLKPQRRRTPIGLEKFLINLIGDTVEYREKNNIKRNDFLDLLIQLKNKGTIGEDMSNEISEPLEMDLGLMTAQCFVFLFAGFETSSSVQSFCLYELALNKHIQDKLREEILKTIEKHGDVTYQAIQEMEYLHMVISETLRKYPTIPSLIRTCTKQFTTPAGHKILEGDSISIPVWSLHHDPEYYPDPNKFDPERFAPINEGCIKPFTYMPFGEGPRVCIGNRFGLLQTKMGIITVLRNYEVVPSEKTIIPLEFFNTLELTMAKSPIILRLVSKSQ